MNAYEDTNRKKKNDSWGTVLDVATNEYHGKNIMGRLLMEQAREKEVGIREF